MRRFLRYGTKLKEGEILRIMNDHDPMEEHKEFIDIITEIINAASQQSSKQCIRSHRKMVTLDETLVSSISNYFRETYVL